MGKNCSILLLLLLPVISLPAGVKGEEKSGLNTSIIEQEIFRIVNEERKSRNVNTLIYDKRLAGIALLHSKNMAEQNFFSHTDRESRSPQKRVKQYYPEIIGGIGENIAQDFGGSEQEVAKNLMAAWMNSPGHRANILNKDYSYFGAGVYQNGTYYYATQNFIDAIVKVPDNTITEFKFESEATLKFEFVGAFEKDKITIFCEFADRGNTYQMPDGSYYTGAAPLTPVWIDERYFTVTFKFNKGKGIYKFVFGKNGRFFPNGFNVVVK